MRTRARVAAAALLGAAAFGCAGLQGPGPETLKDAFHAQLQGVDFLANLERKGGVITFDIPGGDQGMFRVKPSSWSVTITDADVAPNDDEMKPWIGRIESDWSQTRDGQLVQGNASMSIPRGITDRGIGPTCGAYWGSRTKQWNWVGAALGPIRRSGPAAGAGRESAERTREASSSTPPAKARDDIQLQRRTMSGLRTAGTAIESYSIDYKWYPTGDTASSLRDRLSPTYVRELPTKDGWGHEIRYAAWEDDETDGGPTHYVLVSPGRDGRFEMDDPRAYERGGTNTFDSDVVFNTGSFHRYPEGPQH